MSCLKSYQPIFSPTQKPLNVLLFKGKEGIECRGVRVFEGVISARELVDHFSVEMGSHEMPEHLKRQRDLEKSRSQALNQYFEDREDTVLPSLTIFVSEFSSEEEICVNNRELVCATIDPHSDRLIADGQNRLTLFSSRLSEHPELENHTVSIKFIVTDTPTLESSTAVIRQLFCDYHEKLRKPTASQNLFFDSAQPYSELMRQLLEITIGKGESETQLMKYISITGRVKSHQFMQFKQLQKMLNIVTGSSESKINTMLKANPEQKHKLYDLCSPLLSQFFNMLPLHQMDSVLSEQKSLFMFNKAIYWNGVAWLMRSMIEDGLASGKAVDWSILNNLNNLPLADMTDKFWQEAKVVYFDTDKNTYTMMKGTEKKMGRCLCHHLRVYYCKELG